jgi:hypothetical protein
MANVNVERIREIREELITRYGGIEGYFKHCQAQDRALAARSKNRRRKRPTRANRKKPKEK